MLRMHAGEWAGDRRHGWGMCRFADGARFKGEWEEDAWVQSLAEARRCRAKGPGLSRAAAGAEATFLISVHAPAPLCAGPLHLQPAMVDHAGAEGIRRYVKTLALSV